MSFYPGSHSCWLGFASPYLHLWPFHLHGFTPHPKAALTALGAALLGSSPGDKVAGTVLSLLWVRAGPGALTPGQPVPSRAGHTRPIRPAPPAAVVLHLLLTGCTVLELWLGKSKQEFSSIRLRVCPECFRHAGAAAMPFEGSDVSPEVTHSNPRWDLQHTRATVRPRESPRTNPGTKQGGQRNPLVDRSSAAEHSSVH